MDGGGGRTALDNKTSLLNTPSPRSFSGPRGREFAPYGYGETISSYDKSALKEAVFDDDVETFKDCEYTPKQQDNGLTDTNSLWSVNYPSYYVPKYVLEYLWNYFCS